MFLDIKHALKLLIRTTKFSALSLMVLVGWLSISLLIFSVLYTFVYKPLPLPEGESILYVDMYNENLPAYEFLEVRKELNSFSESGVWNSMDLRLSRGDSGRTLNGSRVETNIFQFTRTPAIMGRVLQAHDSDAGAPAVAVISYRIWKSVFNQSNEVIGSVAKFDNVDTVIVGVMPEGYNFPVSEDIWLPMSRSQLNPKANDTASINAYARLKNGVSIDEANAELTDRIDILYQRNIKKYNKEDIILQGDLISFPEMQTSGDGTASFIFFNLSAFFILMLACNNVGNFLLSRAIDRQKETAIRSALGARVGRLVSQLMWEGIIITTLGAILSLLVVSVSLNYINILLQSQLGDRVAFWWLFELDTPTIIMAVVFTLFMLFVACFLPALKAANQNMNDTIRDGTRGAQGKKAGRLSRGLMLFQISLISTLMLIGSLVSYVANVSLEFKTGYQLSNLMEGRYILPKNKYLEENEKLTFVKEFTQRLSRQHAIQDSLVSFDFRDLTVAINGVDYPDEESKPQMEVNSIIGSLAVQGLALKSGRYLDQRDNNNSQRTAVISVSMANRYWLNESPINKKISVTIDDDPIRFTIVGVVGNKFNHGNIFDELDSYDEVYLSGEQYSRDRTVIYFKSNGNTVKAHESFYQTLFVMDKEAEVYYIDSLEDKIAQIKGYVVAGGSGVLYAGIFSLFMALTGVYSLTANLVSQRTHEIGIRRAVGARDSDVIKLMLKQASRQLIIGLGIGLMLFILMSVLFNSFTEGSVPLILYFTIAITVSFILSAIVMLAIYIPTRNAVALEPSIAFQQE